MNHLYIKAKQFIFSDRIESGGYLHIYGDQIEGLIKEVPKNATVIDYSQYTIAPGLIDTHIHGIAGVDVMDCNKEAILKMAEELLSCGVTAFLPTTLTSSEENLISACSSIKEATLEENNGAEIVGIYMEGPYFTEKHKGAQNPIYFKDSSFSELDDWIKASDNMIRKVALAAERNNSNEYFSELKKRGIVGCIGHTDSTFSQCADSIDAGASMFVHTFNGMSPLHHREPGAVGAAMYFENTYAELIPDLMHVHPAAMEILIRSKGVDHVCLISDCMRAGKMADGNYHLGEFVVKVEDGRALTESGSLAGSTLQLLEGVKNVANLPSISLVSAFKMASLIPARSINIDKTHGSLDSGKVASFIVVDEELNLQASYVRGQRKWTK